MTVTFESLPVELIAEILGELDLESLIKTSYLSRRMLAITSDSSLNPWRRPILRNLRSATYEDCLSHLSVRQTVPRQNWIEILSLARPSFILYDATLPNLKAADWEECFNRRFLPGWKKWKRDDASWRETFIKLLHRVWHRSQTSCTADESWTRYIVLNRNGSANELEASSRAFNPVAIFNDMKLQSNLAHLETRIRLVVTLADVRILAFGTLNRPRSTLMVNPNAHIFLHPPGIEADETDINPRIHRTNHHVTDHGVYPMGDELSDNQLTYQVAYDSYTRLTHPLPAVSHFDYPWFTPGGSDKRWLGSGEEEEEGLCWVGGLMVVAQIVGPKTYERSGDWSPLQDLDLVLGPGRQQYVSFTWNDLNAIAPWMEERITKKINGPGLGI
ncbi:uncharacterized protein BT62DRAFT_1054621 [Guyanagaster necrorhizus]|uniref:F-box domain-containing protein n=1 Tax=Guyanagaster necrorhizus TaxID=856835 RepID=A0A9P7VZ91_9AGAR|nr:uncharacterized protein BT62DRAFT_1054621 [Guyanagaster necrorhizus MCA 3950]KAG7449485.1 hypothetical protein BT62DRAFT_1054621 [Guyanagaster necrorhizus MCA 3950]